LKYARYILLIGILALLIGGTYWARGKSRDEVCTEIKVDIVNKDGTTFVTAENVISEMERKRIFVKGKPVWQINVEELEKVLGQSQYVESVECMFVNGGCLNIKVAQIVPVMRIFDGDDSYYINKDGKRMQAVANFTADVPVVEGRFTGSFSPLQMLPMVQYVEENPELKSLVSMYSVQDRYNIFIIPAMSGHVINMGDGSNYESKFKKLKLFYNKVMPVKGWMCYDTISLKWDYQVVATHRDKLIEVHQEYDPEEDEVADDPSTMKVSDNSKAPVNKMTAEKAVTPPAPAKKTPEKSSTDPKSEAKKEPPPKSQETSKEKTEKKEKTPEKKEKTPEKKKTN